jgi:hypothetical protein
MAHPVVSQSFLAAVSSLTSPTGRDFFDFRGV